MKSLMNRAKKYSSKGIQFAFAFCFAATVFLTLTAAAQSCDPPSAGLVSWWQGESNALDAIGGNSGVLEGGMSYAAGKVGLAFSSPGNGSAVLVGNPASLQLQSFTIEAWIKRGSTNTAGAAPGGGEIFCYGLNGYGMGILDNGTPFLTKIGVDNVQGGQQIADTNFHHLAITKNGQVAIIYVDGTATFMSTNYVTSYVFNTSAAIGARGDDFSASFLGLIDEVSIYNRALLPAEISAIYAAGSAGKCGASKPSITQIQPTNQTVNLGDTALFTVIAGGTPPLSYTWQIQSQGSNYSNLNGATNFTLSLTNVQATNNTNYRVIVSNASGSTTSAPVNLSVIVPASCAGPPGGIVSWWQAEGSAIDIIGGNNGVIQGNITYVAGKVGMAFNSDGNGSGILVGNPASLQLQSFTIEAWVRRSSTSQASLSIGGGVIFGYGSGGYALGMLDNGTPYLSNVGNNNVQGGQITDTNFHHLAVTKNGQTTVIYVDGAAALVTNYPTTFQFSTSAAIGARGDNFGGSFLGLIDEMSIYNRPLLPSEIQNIYNAGALGKCTGPTLPSITQIQPTNQSVIAGTNASFIAAAAGTPALTYSWQFQNTNITGATNFTLTLANVQPTNAGNYRVIVTNSSGSITSAPATLTVLSPPSFTLSPSNQLVPLNGTAVFVVALNGSDPLYYQWRLNNTNLAGQTNYQLQLNNVQVTNAGQYTVFVTNGIGSITSAPASLTLILPPTILTNPVAQTNYLGGNARFSVVATNYTNLFYQWQLNGTNIAGAASSLLALANLQSSNAGAYSVIVSNSAGLAVTSSNALLTLSNPACAPPPSGLIGWWQANSNTYDAISGSNGVAHGSVGYAAGKVGQAFTFNGTNGSGVSLGNPTNYQLQNFTIEAWVQRSNAVLATSGGAGSGVLFCYGSGGYGFGMLNDGTLFLTDVDNNNVQGGQKVNDTAFHHLAVTKNGTTVVIYVDGVPTLTTNYSAVFSFGTSVAIGARGDNFNAVFLGLIDEVSLYNRALAATEIQSLYASTAIGKCPVALAYTTASSNQSIFVGSNATLNVNFTGSGPITFQWFLNGSAILGATNSTLALSNITFFQGGAYTLTASNGAGPLTLSNIVVTVKQTPLLVNGGFETGDFTGWVVSNLSFPSFPLTVRSNGFNPGDGFFFTAPTEGIFAATHGFDGGGPGRISLAQDVVVPKGPAMLNFDYRAAWDMLDYAGSTLPRTFSVSISPLGGGTPFQTSNLLTAAAGTANFDTGPLSGSLDLTAFAGQGLRINFDATVPEFFTGPGFFQLDNVVLNYAILPVLSISPAGTNVTIYWRASPTNYTLQANSDLSNSNTWTAVNSNLMIHGVTNTSVTVPFSPGSSYYRLRYP